MILFRPTHIDIHEVDVRIRDIDGFQELTYAGFGDTPETDEVGRYALGQEDPI